MPGPMPECRSASCKDAKSVTSSATMSVPPSIRSHPAFKPGITRSEIDSLLTLPDGPKFVLRENNQKRNFVVTFVQPFGAIAHTEIDFDSNGQVLTGNLVFSNVDAFVAWLRSPSSTATWPNPSVAELRQISQLARTVCDGRMSKGEMRQRLESLPFLVWPSSKRQAWVITRLRPGSQQLANLFVRPAPSGQGFVVEGNSDLVFGDLLAILHHVGLVPRAVKSSSVYANIDELHDFLAVEGASLYGSVAATTVSGVYDDPSVLFEEGQQPNSTLFIADF